MKKLIIALLALVSAFGVATAQNANRTGFFVEAAIGGSVGSTPRVAIALDGTNLNQYFAGGAAFNIAFGPRMRTSNHVAFDLRFEFQAPISYVGSAPVAKIMPAVHYTSKELFGNMSMYFTVGLGGAVGAGYKTAYSDYDWDSYDNYYFDNVLMADGSKTEFGLGDASVAAGVSYLINVGLNVTNHFYAGLMWDAQYMFSQPGKDGKNTCHWGMSGLQIGYRF